MSYTPPQPDRESVDPEERPAYDRVIRRQTAYRYDEFEKILPAAAAEGLPGDRIQPYFGALLNSPLIADHISELGVVHRTRGERSDSYTHADREWADMVLSQEMGCNMVYVVHMPDAVAVGVRPEAIKALREGRYEDMTPEERQLAEYVRAVLDGQVTEEMFKGVQERLGVRGVVEYTAIVTHLIMTLRMIQAFGVPEPSDSDVDDMLARLLEGSVELPDPTARVPSLELA